MVCLDSQDVEDHQRTRTIIIAEIESERARHKAAERARQDDEDALRDVVKHDPGSASSNTTLAASPSKRRTKGKGNKEDQQHEAGLMNDGSGGSVTPIGSGLSDRAVPPERADLPGRADLPERDEPLENDAAPEPVAVFMVPPSDEVHVVQRGGGRTLASRLGSTSQRVRDQLRVGSSALAVRLFHKHLTLPFGHLNQCFGRRKSPLASKKTLGTSSLGLKATSAGGLRLSRAGPGHAR